MTRKITYTDEVTDSYSGQVNARATISINGKEVGTVDYVLFDKEMTISYIFVKPKYRRKGFGSRLIKYIQQENSDYKYVASMKTGKGAKFQHRDLPLDEKLVKEYLWEK